MWTPKRILLLVSGFIVCLAAYIIYAHVLGMGGIDSLPPLPPEYISEAGTDDPGPELQAPRQNEIGKKLQQAFSAQCEELSRPIKMESRPRRMVLAAGEFIIEREGPHTGQVKLTPFSMALFGKDIGPGKLPEINTIKCETAYLSFDRPISKDTDMDKRKIVGAELQGNIEIVNNRRTAERDDDIVVRVPSGSMLYLESQHRIWTDGAVELKDMQSKPKPMTMNADGMDMYLLADTEPAQPSPKPSRKPKNESVSGVERIVLRSNVEMHLFVDSHSGFLGAAPKDVPEREAQAAPSATEKAHVIIKTHGPFRYEIARDLAQFDIPPIDPNLPDALPEQVVVNRYNELADKVDEMLCEHLELQFHRKEASAQEKATEERGLGLEIDTAHATGKEVVIKSEAETLEAHGNDFVFNANLGLTTLRGDPEMWALKEGSEIHARELQMLDPKNGKQQKGTQQVTALGPGTIDMFDKNTGKRPQHARWKDKLVSTKDGPYDLLTLTGSAAFLDDEHNSVLQAESLKVWLEKAQPEEPGSAPRPAPAPATQQSSRPHHIEAISRVLLNSPTLHVHDTERLVVWCRDATQAEREQPATGPEAPAKTPGTLVSREPPADAGSNPQAGPTPTKPQRPIDLTARSVEAFIVRDGAKNELEKLWTEGAVRVLQEPGTPDEKGVDIRGETLKLTRKADGNLLEVTGDLAQLKLDKLFIVGPEVNIDQGSNKAWANGIGAMQIESTTDFNGKQLKKPVPLTIHWNKFMVFNNGKDAEFHGGVQAEQENARVLCQTMQVTLDHPVSLREGEKNGPPPRVKNLVCHQGVRIEQKEMENGKLIKYQRLESPSVALDNEEGIVIASGPGIVRTLQPGTADTAPSKSSKSSSNTPRTDPQDEMKLTRVKYGGRMWANNKRRLAIFYEDVEVIYLPADQPDVVPDVDNLPPGGMFVHCDQLKVYSQQDANQKGQQQMEAHGRVTVHFQDYWARADIVTYHEGKDLVIFEGTNGNLASVYHKTAAGGKPQELKGKKILYSRKTGEFKLEEGLGVSG